jgi:hypothetical protein
MGGNPHPPLKRPPYKKAPQSGANERQPMPGSRRGQQCYLTTTGRDESATASKAGGFPFV